MRKNRTKRETVVFTFLSRPLSLSRALPPALSPSLPRNVGTIRVYTYITPPPHDLETGGGREKHARRFIPPSIYYNARVALPLHRTATAGRYGRYAVRAKGLLIDFRAGKRVGGRAADKSRAGGGAGDLREFREVEGGVSARARSSSRSCRLSACTGCVVQEIFSRRFQPL